MANRQGIGQARKARATALVVAAALGLLTGCHHRENATQVAPSQALPPKAQPVKERLLADHFPDQPSLPPVGSVPLAPLGFTAPSSNYLGSRNTFVSLDFIDEDRLLFTFRVPGLIHRDLKTGEESNERQIRAVVLKLPQGTDEARIEAEALWTVHDRVRYLWPLKSGHFLLRDRNNLFEGDATLRLKPFLDFPGPLLRVELDPEQQFLVTNSREPFVAEPKSGQVLSPATASATVTSDEDDAAAQEDRPELVVRILRRTTGEVMLVSRVRTAVHLPINNVGYIENLRGQGTMWMLNLSYFTGGSKLLGSVETACDPDDEFLSQDEILITGCNSDGASKLVAMTTEGKTLWISQAPSTEVWPQLAVAPNGSRLAWTTLDASHPVSMFAPMNSEDVKEQSVTVFDAATGDIAFVSPLSPILDAGGNVAISPSGRRVALVNAGAIQIFDLPAASGAK
ncbi:MAG: hypothetical protein ABSA85_14795 [Terracidiphilus sp.]|jgi:hypothetical protein